MRRTSRYLAALAVALAAAATAPAAAPAAARGSWADRVAAAEGWADGRAGAVSFAVVDEDGRLRGDHVDRVHHSASVVKVLFMVAFLREPGIRDDELTEAERNLLGPMIKRSDNKAATAIYNRLGAERIEEVARDVGLGHFTTQPYWGRSTIAAGEWARFLYRLERQIPRRHRSYAMKLLARIVPSQRWGIPSVAPDGWKLHFKGGWSGSPTWRVNQVMLLRRPPRRLALAILTRDQPSKRYGIATIEGVAKRLLRGYR